jgi:hypothetical protein
MLLFSFKTMDSMVCTGIGITSPQSRGQAEWQTGSGKNGFTGLRLTTCCVNQVVGEFLRICNADELQTGNP